MDISDIQDCAIFYKREYLQKYYLVTTYSNKSIMLIAKEKNFPHLMGIKKNVFNSNGYKNAKKLYDDILVGNNINTRIIPNRISTKSKMYKKVINFKNSIDIFWKNNGPLAINYKDYLSTSKLSSIDFLLIDINKGYMTGWASDTEVDLNNEIKLKKFCISTWIDESSGSQKSKEKYMPSQDIDIIREVFAFDGMSNIVRQKTYKYLESDKEQILNSISRNNSNLLLDNRNEKYYVDIAIRKKITCTINGKKYN